MAFPLDIGNWLFGGEPPQAQQHDLEEESEIKAEVCVVVEVAEVAEAEDRDLPPTTEEEPTMKEPPPAAVSTRDVLTCAGISVGSSSSVRAARALGLCLLGLFLC